MTSMIVSGSSLTEAAMVCKPTGPPSYLSTIVRSTRRSVSSRPSSSISGSARARPAPGGGGAEEGDARRGRARGARPGPLANHDVEGKILHRRVEDPPDRPAQPMDLV